MTGYRGIRLYLELSSISAAPRSRPGGTLVAKFLRVGVHHSNVGGYTSKAWTIRRIGSTVLLKWGSVEVRGAGRVRRIYWASRPRQKTVRCGSEKQALDYVKRTNARQLGHRYESCWKRCAFSPVLYAVASRPVVFLPRSFSSISFALPRKPRCWATVAGMRCSVTTT